MARTLKRRKPRSMAEHMALIDADGPILQDNSFIAKEKTRILDKMHPKLRELVREIGADPDGLRQLYLYYRQQKRLSEDAALVATSEDARAQVAEYQRRSRQEVEEDQRRHGSCPESTRSRAHDPAVQRRLRVR